MARTRGGPWWLRDPSRARISLRAWHRRGRPLLIHHGAAMSPLGAPAGGGNMAQRPPFDGPHIPVPPPMGLSHVITEEVDDPGVGGRYAPLPSAL